MLWIGKRMSSMFRVLRSFLVKLTPILMPSRDKAYIQFTVESLSTHTSQANVASRRLSVLDVGGSFGRQAHTLVEMLARHRRKSFAVVLDIDIKSIVKGKALPYGLHYIRGDAHHLPFRSDVFHIIYSYSLLEHLQNPALAISEQVRVCKRAVILQIPNLSYLIEPHTKAPLLCYYPNVVRHKVVAITNPDMYLNFTVNYKNVIKWFNEAGAKLLKSSRIYHVKWMRMFFIPQGLIMLFGKQLTQK